MSYYDRSFDPQKRHGLHSVEREAKWQPHSLLRSELPHIDLPDASVDWI